MENTALTSWLTLFCSSGSDTLDKNLRLNNISESVENIFFISSVCGKDDRVSYFLWKVKISANDGWQISCFSLFHYLFTFRWDKQVRSFKVGVQPEGLAAVSAGVCKNSGVKKMKTGMKEG